MVKTRTSQSLLQPSEPEARPRLLNGNGHKSPHEPAREDEDNSDSDPSVVSPVEEGSESNDDSNDDEDEGVNEEEEFVQRRSQRQLAKESQSWVTGGGPSAKGYPTGRGADKTSTTPNDGLQQLDDETEEEAEPDDSYLRDSQDLYTRIKGRSLRRGGRGRRQSVNYSEMEKKSERTHSPRKLEPVASRLRVRKPKIYDINLLSKSRITNGLSGRKRFFRHRRSRHTSEDNDSSTEDDEEEMIRPKKKKAKMCSTGSQELLGSIELYEPLKPDPGVTFDSVGGLDEFVQKLREVILFPMLYRTFYESRCIKPPRGILFYGPPGTGKTLMARAVASEASVVNGRQVSFFMLKGSDILSKWVGESEKAIKQVFESATKRQPSIIFFDEIDGLAASRSVKTDQFHNSLVSTFLAELDGLRDRGHIIVIGATNRIDAIDPAFRRAGRFDYELKFRLPDHNARRAILTIHTSAWPDTPSESLINELAAQTAGYNGADLKLICSEACLAALKKSYPQIYKRKERLVINNDNIKVTHSDFMKALDLIPRSSARSTSSLTTTGIPLPSLVKPLLQRSVDAIQEQIGEMFPYLTAAVRQPSRKRLLIFCDNEYLVPAVLNTMDTLPINTLSTQSVSTSESESKTIITVFSEANVKTGVLYIPDIDIVYSILNQQGKFVFLNELNRLDTSLILASSSNESLPAELSELFQTIDVLKPTDVERHEFFERIFTVDALRVQVDIPEEEELELEVADFEIIEDTQAVSKYEDRTFRELRIFLREKLEKMANNKQFLEFTKPVDLVEVPDYLTIIQNPMDFETMMCKVNSGVYLTAEMFLADIYLIADNALEYNPARKPEDKRIRHRAYLLRDIAQRAIDNELNSDFEESCAKIVRSRENRKTLIAENESKKLEQKATNSKKPIAVKRKRSMESTKNEGDFDDLGYTKTILASRYAELFERYLERLVQNTEYYTTSDLLDLRYKLQCSCQKHYLSANKDILVKEIKSIVRNAKNLPAERSQTLSRNSRSVSLSSERRNKNGSVSQK